MKKNRASMAEAIGQLELALGDLPTGCEPAGTVLARVVREGREAEAGRAVPKLDPVQNARVPSLCKEGV